MKALPGAVGEGTWNMAVVTPETELAWRHPLNHQVPLFSAGPLSEVTLLQNVFLPESLTVHIAQLAQSIAAFNDALAQYNAFKLGDTSLHLRVHRKLDAAARARFPDGNRANMTRDDLLHILASANFTQDEFDWCDTLFYLMAQAHLFFIGGPVGQPGLYRRLQDLEAELIKQVG